MLEMRLALWALATAFFLFLVVDWGTSVTVLGCEQYDGDSHVHNEPEKCTSLRSTVFEGAEPIVSRTFAWLDIHSGMVTGVATALLAIITALLACIASDQIKTTRAQLRAYVWVPESSINDVLGTVKVRATLKIQNSGQTPASEVTQWGRLGYGPYPLGQIIHQLEGGPESAFSSKSYLGPGGSLFLEPIADRLYSPQEIASIKAKTGAIYVWGEIKYRDAFRRDQSTKFVLFKGGDVGTSGQNLSSYRDGNEAT
jgi:hypothetical protein